MRQGQKSESKIEKIDIENNVAESLWKSLKPSAAAAIYKIIRKKYFSGTTSGIFLSQLKIGVILERLATSEDLKVSLGSQLARFNCPISTVCQERFCLHRRQCSHHSKWLCMPVATGKDMHKLMNCDD